MAIEKKEFDYAKEVDDVFALVVEVVKTIKEKGSYLALIDDLVKAVNGVQDVPAEVENKKALGVVAGYRLAEIVELFTKQETA